MGPVKNVKVKLFLFSLLGIILIVSTPVISSVLVNLSSPQAPAPLSSTATVFVDPVKVIEDYEDLPVGSNFTVHVNVSDVSDLFTWQINMSWDSSLLNVSRIIPGDFLATSVNQTSSEALGGVVINATDNVQGSSAFAESILANVSGISGGGRLVSVEFNVTGYGCCNLTINVGGTLPTVLLNSTGDSMTFTATNGYFRNKLTGDVTGEGEVDISDILKVKYHRSGPPEGPGGYERNVDVNDDGDIDISDILLVKANRGRSVVI